MSVSAGTPATPATEPTAAFPEPAAPLPESDAPAPPSPSSGQTPLRRIWLCADDYGLAPGVSQAIRELIRRGRLNATSVMVLPRSFDRQAAQQLELLRGPQKRVAVGLHLTMTAPFRPLTGFRPVAADGRFLPIGDMLKYAFWPRFDRALVRREVEAQMQAFAAAFGHPPDFIDGHHHVQLLPRIDDAVLAAVKSANPAAWVRQCRQVKPLLQRLHDRKGILIDLLSRRFQRRAKALGVSSNAAFAGTYRFDPTASFAASFPAFLDGLPDGSVVMCHPGFVDAELEGLDSLTTLREKEFAFLTSDAFATALAKAGLALA